MKKVLVASFHHESNGFTPITSNENDFRVYYQDEIYEHIKENDSISGIITTLKNHDVEVIPTVFMRAVPNGEVDEVFFNEQLNKFISIAKNHLGKIDAITLALHGSMRIRNMASAEAIIVETLKELFPEIPIFISLDMHASISERLIHHCQGMVGYKTAPHIDCTETGIHAAQLTINYLENHMLPYMSVVKVPMLIAGEQSATDTYPMNYLMNELKLLEQQEHVLAASYLLGFPWSDNVDNQVSVCVVTSNNQHSADLYAQQLADKFYSLRHEFTFVTKAYPPKIALEKALDYTKNKDYPIYISDAGDNPTAGAAADNTNFLKLCLDNCHIDILDETLIYAGLYDPIATKACEHKVGEYIHLTFGASFDSIGSEPINQIVYVKNYIKDYNYNNMPNGDIALINIVNIDIILVEKHIGFTESKMFYDLGLEPKNHPIIICKLGYLTPSHQAISKMSILALSDGHTPQDLSRIQYKHVNRPLFPLD